MTPEEIEACWRDRRNYRWGVYHCKEDPRVIVPKRIKWMGWTFNAARPGAIPVVLLLIAVLVVPIFVVSFKGASMGIVLLTAVASITAVCLVCAHLASPKRWSH